MKTRRHPLILSGNGVTIAGIPCYPNTRTLIMKNNEFLVPTIRDRIWKTPFLHLMDNLNLKAHNGKPCSCVLGICLALSKMHRVLPFTLFLNAVYKAETYPSMAASSWARGRAQLAFDFFFISFAVTGFQNIAVYCWRFRADHLHVTDPGTTLGFREALSGHHGIYFRTRSRRCYFSLRQ